VFIFDLMNKNNQENIYGKALFEEEYQELPRRHQGDMRMFRVKAQGNCTGELSIKIIPLLL
jgi:hypothetical protein